MSGDSWGWEQGPDWPGKPEWGGALAAGRDGVWEPLNEVQGGRAIWGCWVEVEGKVRGESLANCDDSNFTNGWSSGETEGGRKLENVSSQPNKIRLSITGDYKK